MIAIIDYDAGNIRSVEKAFQFLGEETILTRDKDVILGADKVVLPGVGSFGDAMEKLNKYDLVDTVKEVVSRNIPFLGICLGLQLLFEESDETPGVKGLGILPGKIIKIPEGEGLKVPHIGWNSLDFHNNGRLFKGIDEKAYVYFVHSYYANSSNKELVAYAEYEKKIPSIVRKDNVYGLQFHPEKSGEVGQNILKAYKELIVK